MKEREKKQYIFPMIILIIIVGNSFLQQGIMCNDELLLRLYGQRGVRAFFRTTVITEGISKGRILGTIGNFKVLSFISDNRYIFRAIDILVILSAIVLFSYLIYRLFGNFEFSFLLGVLILIFIPVTFEFASPNAFVIVCFEPMILLILSLLQYIKYLEYDKRKNLIISLLFFIWAMFLYEFMITYVFIYLAIYFIKKLDCKFEIRKMIQSWIPIVFAAVLYLILYIGQGYIFPTQYSGTQLGTSSIKAIFDVVKMLMISAIPGYYTFFNDKHKYLFGLYNGGGIGLDNIIAPTLIIFCISLFVILYKIFKDQNDALSNVNRKKTIYIVMCSFCYWFLPALPNGVSLMYQGHVTPESFTSLPVSIYLYFSFMFMVTFILWKIKNAIGNKFVKWLLIGVIVFGASGVQISNTVFAQEQLQNYNRIEAIEDILRLGYWDSFGDLKIYAPSFYETRNSMAVENGHWTQYANIFSKQLQVDSENSEECDMFIELQDDNSFYVYWDDVSLIVSTEIRSGEICLRDTDKHYRSFTMDSVVWEENGYIIYNLKPVE